MKLQTGLLAVLLAVSTVGKAQQGLQQRLSDTRGKAFPTYQNPAFAGTRYGESFSEMRGTFSTDHADKAVIAQLGRGHTAGAFDASSYQKMGKHGVAWGHAGYDRRHIKDVRWNETADFLTVYPYVTADSVGGKMEAERYSFRLGYAQGFRKWSYGVEAAYQSALHYRDTDPRPKDNSLFVNLTLGASRALSSRYSGGLYLHWQRYSQEQSIAFMNPYGTMLLYQMSGMNMHYHRFAGTLGQAYYTGHTFGAGLTLQPIGHGFDVMLYAERRRLQKQLSGLNNAPINDLQVWTYRGGIAWRSDRRYALLSGAYSSREGSENIYDDGIQNYHRIAITKPFKAVTAHITAEASQEWTAGAWTLSATPSLMLFHHRQSYKTPARKMSLSSLVPKLAFQTMLQRQTGLLTARISVANVSNLHKSISISEPKAFPQQLPTLTDNYEMLSSSAWMSEADVRYDHAIGKPFNTIFMQAKFQHTTFSTRHQRNLFKLSVGVTL